jgi:hypothetical protein
VFVTLKRPPSPYKKRLNLRTYPLRVRTPSLI